MLGRISNLNKRKMKFAHIFPNVSNIRAKDTATLRPYCRYINVHGTEYIHM